MDLWSPARAGPAAPAPSSAGCCFPLESGRLEMLQNRAAPYLAGSPDARLVGGSNVEPLPGLTSHPRTREQARAWAEIRRAATTCTKRSCSLFPLPQPPFTNGAAAQTLRSGGTRRVLHLQPSLTGQKDSKARKYRAGAQERRTGPDRTVRLQNIPPCRYVMTVCVSPAGLACRVHTHTHRVRPARASSWAIALGAVLSRCGGRCPGAARSVEALQWKYVTSCRCCPWTGRSRSMSSAAEGPSASAPAPRSSGAPTPGSSLRTDERFAAKQLSQYQDTLDFLEQRR
ncbi:MAGUK p55 subfamily member 2 [Platysternon megacephalum]|uniref:MAGUK p55 subfamily member 2 n=1 Tax=Platysternon megacephalum TaxID=55544 RepID=A0A4D9ELI6_9SAUR|nr:MAGUK p55 subfamily member 2 [Platysternon megacephalum]